MSAGEVLDGRWHVEARIAEGGMGAVYRAREPALDRQVAIKFLMPGRVSHRAAVERFLAEARQTAALRHPNIVAIHAVGERHGTPFMVMEFLDGEPLDRRIARGPLPPSEVLSIVRQVVSALELLRSKGLVHRDIKPGNIVVDARGHATLLDFGLSRKQVRDEGGLTAAGVVVGTPGYLAPERALGTAEIDHRSDLFSIGLVTFELLTGRRAITAEHPAALLGKQLTAPVLDPRAVRPELPEALEAFFARACAQAPAARFQDGAEFLAGLELALGAQPGEPGPGRRWWPIAAGAAAAAALT
ncbi:MAG: serine/threonine protein kinase, partial [Myxococcaceae bacterium]|nr:serine/threonine protein kinase [Myxococcaceae bacterium]